MNYHEIVDRMQRVYANASSDKIDGHVAVQFNITGEGEGALYIEVTDGRVEVEPFEYYDRNAVVTLTADVLLDIVEGRKDINTAFNDNLFYVEGDLGAVLLLNNIDIDRNTKDNVDVDDNEARRNNANNDGCLVKKTAVKVCKKTDDKEKTSKNTTKKTKA